MLFLIYFAVKWTSIMEAFNFIIPCVSFLFMLQWTVQTPSLRGLENTTLEAFPGSFLDITCTSRGQPLPQISWIHNGKDVTQLFRVAVDASGLVLSKLRINFTSVEDVLLRFSCVTMKSSTVTCTGPRYTCSAAYVEVPNALPVSLAAAVIVYLCKFYDIFAC